MSKKHGKSLESGVRSPEEEGKILTTEDTNPPAADASRAEGGGGEEITGEPPVPHSEEDVAGDVAAAMEVTPPGPPASGGEVAEYDALYGAALSGVVAHYGMDKCPLQRLDELAHRVACQAFLTQATRRAAALGMMNGE